MKNIKIIICSLTLLLVMGGCSDFEEFQTDPNRTTVGHPGLLLTGIEASAFSAITLESTLACRQMVFVEYSWETQYYGWQRSGFGHFSGLRQVSKMEEEAELIGNTNYLAIGKFFKSYYMLRLTRVFGDVPYSEALKGADDEPNFKPVYDKQEDIYLGILEDLKAANTMLDSEGGIINGDIIYDGDITKWKKAINSLSLRILISLSSKEGNTKIGVVNRFQEIINNPSEYPIFTSNSDNAALPYYDIEGNRYPHFNANSIKTAYYFDESFVNMLKDREDPRLFSYAQPEGNGATLPRDDFNAYGGLGGSDLVSINSDRLATGEGSRVNERFYNDPTNEPSIALGYAEVEFTIAEAAARGWISDDPAMHYENAIRASLEFSKIDPNAIDDYLQNTEVQYVTQDGIEMIVTQKYISFFMNSGWESFYNQRRTGFPEFSTDGAGILNDGMIPKRWMYPESEITNNGENLQEAISRQFPNGDNINGEMWLLKNE